MLLLFFWLTYLYLQKPSPFRILCNFYFLLLITVGICILLHTNGNTATLCNFFFITFLAATARISSCIITEQVKSFNDATMNQGHLMLVDPTLCIYIQ